MESKAPTADAGSSAAQQSTPPPRPKHPRVLIMEALSADSMEDYKCALEVARLMFKADQSAWENFLRSILGITLRSGKAEMAAYLIDEENIPADWILPMNVATVPNISLYEVVVARGFDINRSDAGNTMGEGKSVIDWSTRDYNVMRWLVEHGADLNHGKEDYEMIPKPSPLTETVAMLGSVRTMKLILEHGAKIGRRTLHRAVGSGAAVGADPSAAGDGAGAADGDTVTGNQEARYRRDREGMVRFLVDHLKLDVNQQDAEKPHGHFHWGTPINYAVNEKKGAAMTRWLLSKGADPTVKGLEVQADALEWAEANKCDEVAEVLREWATMKGAEW